MSVSVNVSRQKSIGRMVMIRNQTFLTSTTSLGKRLLEVILVAVCFGCVLQLSSVTLASELFDKTLLGQWGPSYDDLDKTWFVFGSSSRGSNMLCASSDSSSTKSGYYLFMECRGDNGYVT